MMLMIYMMCILYTIYMIYMIYIVICPSCEIKILNSLYSSIKILVFLDIQITVTAPLLLCAKQLPSSLRRPPKQLARSKHSNKLVHKTKLIKRH